MPDPYSIKSNDILERIHCAENFSPKYEASLMALLSRGLATSQLQGVFGDYSDYLVYVPTNLGTEMDILLMYNNPRTPRQVISYEIIEVKNAIFDKKALRQLIGYETWLIDNHASRDTKMVRATAIAARFDSEVIDYVKKREWFEGKKIKLLQYSANTKTGNLDLELIE